MPDLVELVMARPLVSAGMVAKMLEVTPQAGRRIVLELDLREMTGRGRFWAWGLCSQLMESAPGFVLAMGFDKCLIMRDYRKLYLADTAFGLSLCDWHKLRT